MTKYRYANSILWGPTFDEASGMHIIEAANDAQAFERANRCDKMQLGMSFLQRSEPDGSWRCLKGPVPADIDTLIADAIAFERDGDPEQAKECWGWAFRAFQATGNNVESIGAAVGEEHLQDTAGRVYHNGFYIERDEDGTGWSLTLENYSYAGTDLEPLERELFDFYRLCACEDDDTPVYASLETGGR